MDLVIDPPESLVDTPPRLAIADTSAGASSTTELSRPDDPDRPWWNMEFADADDVPVVFTAPDDSLDFDIEVSWGGGRCAAWPGLGVSASPATSSKVTTGTCGPTAPPASPARHPVSSWCRDQQGVAALAPRAGAALLETLAGRLR